MPPSDQIPMTFMRYFYIGGNLRWLMASTDWPDVEVYQRMMQRYNEAFRDSAKGTRRADTVHEDIFYPVKPVFKYDEGKETALPREVYDTLLAHINSARKSDTPAFASIFADDTDRRPRLHAKGQPIPSSEHRGVTYAGMDTQLRNSFIVFNQHPSVPSSAFPSAGQICNIFLHGRIEGGERIVEPMFVVNEYRPLSEADEDKDPYRRYPDLHTRLFYNTPATTQRVITADQIRAHFAAYVYMPEGIEEECIVVRSLDRVRSKFFALDQTLNCHS